MDSSVDMHYMRLADEPFELILNGKKTIEVRLADEKRRSVKIGDCITFSRNHGDDRIAVRVVGLYPFATFKALYSSGISDKCGMPGITPEQAVEYISRYYTPEEEAQYGALAIEFEVIE